MNEFIMPNAFAWVVCLIEVYSFDGEVIDSGSDAVFKKV